MGTSPIVTLEERLVKARSSMALRAYLMSFSNRTGPHKMEEIHLKKLLVYGIDCLFNIVVFDDEIIGNFRCPG